MGRVKPEFHYLPLASIHCPTASQDERCLSLKLNGAFIRKKPWILVCISCILLSALLFVMLLLSFLEEEQKSTLIMQLFHESYLK